MQCDVPGYGNHNYAEGLGFNSHVGKFPDIFFPGVSCAGVDMLPKLNCNTLGWDTVPFVYISVTFVLSNQSPLPT